MSAALDSLLAALSNDVRREIEHLRELEAWAYAQQPFKVGDKATIKTPPSIGKSSGWWSCREYLVSGSTGVVTDVHFYNGRWGVLFKPDVQWCASDTFGRRFEERPASFYFDPRWLRKRKKSDQPLTIPADTKEWTYKGGARS